MRPTAEPARTGHRAWTDGRPRMRSESGGNLQSLLDRAKVGDVPGTAGAAGAYSQGGSGTRDSPDRDSNAGGQGSSAGGRHVVGADLRAGFRSRLVRLSAGTIGARGDGEPLEADDGQPEAAGSWKWISESVSTLWITPTARVSTAKGARRRAETIDRKMAQRGRDGRRAAQLSGSGKAAGRRDFAVLANVYLHYVLDEWFEQEVQPRLGGMHT